MHRLTAPRTALLLLAACNIDTLAAEFHATEPPTGTTTADSTSAGASDTSTSTGSEGAAASTGGTGSTSTTSDGDVSTGPADTTGDPSTTTGETTDTTGPASVCGDGVVSGPEECEDQQNANCYNCFLDRRVFVTSQVFGGNWAESSLDYWCNHLAAKAGLIGPADHVFKPWISTTEQSAADRLFHAPGRYVMVNGLVFANSWDDLVAGNIVNALEVDENSQTFVTAVWTDTNPDGTAITPDGGSHCNNWTSDSFFSLAYYGFSDEVDSAWTLYMPDTPMNPTQCDDQRALYCFESP